MPASNFFLTPQQQELLFAALNANRPTPTSAALTMSPTSLNGANIVPKTEDPGPTGFQSSAFLDYDYSFDAADTSLDFSLYNADTSNLLDTAVDGANDDTKTESVTSTTGNDSPDKRGHPDDDDDDGATAKRHEGTEKVAKKPGRKPLTSEPTSKRKAQNRAAQRAFRERKEKHVKDLETKVAELEKASQAANNENGVLRAQIKKMTVELDAYKKRFSLMTSSRSASLSRPNTTFGNSIFNNINDVNFQFEFPKFGQLPGSAPAMSNAHATTSPPTTASTHRSSTTESFSPTNGTSNHTSPLDSTLPPRAVGKEDLSKASNTLSNGSAHTTIDLTSSPSTSSNYNATTNSSCATSSCATSPESSNSNQSPTVAKPLDTLTTIGEEHSSMAAGANKNGVDAGMSQFGHLSTDDVDWLTSQSGFRFDPQLFGDYREPQDHILANNDFSDSFFNDALDVDFITPFNVPVSPVAPKVDLIAQIDAAKEGEFASSSIIHTEEKKSVTKLASGQLLTCNTIWERLQSCPNVQSGDFDLDGLCSDLQKKAKCSGAGAVVNETDFKAVVSKYLKKSGKECPNLEGPSHDQL